MKFILEMFLLITGVSAASGLHFQNDKLFIVSDNSNYLYEYQINENKLEKHILIDMVQNERVEKSKKLDLESITFNNGNYFMFSSGSKPNRTQSFIYSPSQGKIMTQDQKAHYVDFQKQLNISAEDFNIEGSLFTEDALLLFNRGNGPNELNGIIRIPFSKDVKPSFTKVELPKINEKTTGFTDAILVHENIYFLSAAEEGKSSYLDGTIGGSQIGIIDVNTLKLKAIETISLKNKFEGLTLYSYTPESLTFLLCEDPDDDSIESIIYKLTLAK